MKTVDTRAATAPGSAGFQPAVRGILPRTSCGLAGSEHSAFLSSRRRDLPGRDAGQCGLAAGRVRPAGGLEARAPEKRAQPRSLNP